jgi:hypothetical protein
MARHERNACKSTKNQASAKAKTTAICQQQPGRDTPGCGMGKGRHDEPWNEDVTQMQKWNRAEKQITPTPSKQTSRRRMQTNQAHRHQRHAENCGLQTITASGTKWEMVIKRLGEGEKDQPSTHKELFLLFQEMDEWESLDQRLVCVMREIHAESVRIAEDDKLEVVITYPRQARRRQGQQRENRVIVGHAARQSK